MDVLVTEYGIAINPIRADLIKRFKDSKLPIKTMENLKEIADKMTGIPEKIEFLDKTVALVQYRDGKIIDIIKQVKSVTV